MNIDSAGIITTVEAELELINIDDVFDHNSPTHTKNDVIDLKPHKIQFAAKEYVLPQFSNSNIIDNVRLHDNTFDSSLALCCIIGRRGLTHMPATGADVAQFARGGEIGDGKSLGDC